MTKQQLLDLHRRISALRDELPDADNLYPNVSALLKSIKHRLMILEDKEQNYNLPFEEKESRV